MQWLELRVHRNSVLSHARRFVSAAYGISCCCLLAFCFLPSHAFGQNFSYLSIRTDPFSFPIDASNATVTAGLKGNVVQLNPPGIGYGRFSVEFYHAAGAPSKLDTVIDFTITFDARIRSAPTASVRLVIPKGKLRVTEELLIPLPHGIESFSYQTRVDGAYISGLSSERIYRPYDSVQQSIVALVSAADIQNLAKDRSIRLSSGVTASDQAAWSIGYQVESDEGRNDYYASSSSGTSNRLANIDLASSNILDWTPVAKVIVKAEQLNDIDGSLGECLRQYIRNSGMLIVLGKDNFKTTSAQFERWYSGDEPFVDRTWDKENLDIHQAFSTQIGLGKVAIVPSITLQSVLVSPGLERFPSDLNDYNYQLGRVSKFAAQDFWNWSLQQLGQPPVFSFGLLISLFVGVAAPGLLIYCVRSNRSAVLMVLLPLMAFLGTTCLVIFATLNDGFGTYSRVRSLTIVEPDSKHGVCLSRQVVFSGLQPRNGVVFDKESEAWLIESTLGGNYSSHANGGFIEWTPENQIYRGLVTSREQFQFSVCQPMKDMQVLDWLSQPNLGPIQSDNPASPDCEVKNTLKEAIELLVICGGNDTYYLAKDIQPGSTATASAIDAASALKALLDQEKRQPLELPAGLSPTNDVGVVNMLAMQTAQNYSYDVAFSNNSDFHSTLTADLLRPENLKTHACYFAYIREGKHVDRAIEESDEQGSLHLIYGHWRKKP